MVKLGIINKGAEKFPFIPLAPPKMPIPAGTMPPIPSKEDIIEQQDFASEYLRVVASLFTLEQLKKIVEHASAPALQDTESTQGIVRAVGLSMANQLAIMQNPEAQVIRQVLRAHKARVSAWASIRKELAHLRKDGEDHIKYFEERTWYGQTGIKFHRALLSKVQALSLAMDELERHICITPYRKKGQHGGSIDVPTAVFIFVRLSWAWTEAGVTQKIPETKRFQIVKECLSHLGQDMTSDADGALRKAIKKHLRKHPHLAEKVEGNGSELFPWTGELL